MAIDAHRSTMQSLSGRLLGKVLSAYLAVTLAIFFADVFAEVGRQREAIDQELASLHQTFSKSVSYALWNVDHQQLGVIVAGMTQMPSVSRVLVREADGRLISDVAAQGQNKTHSVLPATTFSAQRPVSYMDNRKDWTLGTLEIQSSSHIIVHRIQGSVLFTLVAALLKTAVLVALVKLYFERDLTRPLFAIARRAAAIDPKDPQVNALPVKDGVPDELDVISLAINGLWHQTSATVAALDALNRDLEQQVEHRTAALSQSLAELQHAQRSLIDAEKMAALGGLVAGVAHEINTPVGLGLTAASQFEHLLAELDARFQAGELEERQFREFLREGHELCGSMLRSLDKAAALVRSFKLVAVDQSSDELREFGVADYIEDVLLAHKPALRQAGVAVQLECAPGLRVNSHPGAWSQILSNLINNALIHAFDRTQAEPRLTVEVQAHAKGLQLSVSDNGKGMSEAVQRRIFEPFFTTNRSGGGSGLGMHVIYNLVTQQLHGQVVVHSEPGQGSRFVMNLPLPAPALPTPQRATA